MTVLRGACFHGVDGGCAYCRSIVIADQGPDLDDRFDPCHTGPAARVCGCCADPERTSR